MSFDNRDYDRIRHEEMARIDAREFHARRQERSRQQEVDAHQQEIEKLQHRQRYVLYHGREGAFRITVLKWVVGAAFFFVLAFCVSVKDDGFWSALGQALLCFFVTSAIGVVRGLHIMNSVR